MKTSTLKPDFWHSYLKMLCCLPLAVLNLENSCFAGDQEGGVEVVNIFRLTHCLLCSSQNVFLNIQLQIILASICQECLLFDIFKPIFVKFCWFTPVKICKQFLACKISFCLPFLPVFVKTKMETEIRLDVSPLSGFYIFVFTSTQLAQPLDIFAKRKEVRGRTNHSLYSFLCLLWSSFVQFVDP